MGSKGSKPLMTKFTVLAIRLSSGPCSFGSIGITGVDSGISPCRGSPFPGTVEGEEITLLQLDTNLELKLQEQIEVDGKA